MKNAMKAKTMMGAMGIMAAGMVAVAPVSSAATSSQVESSTYKHCVANADGTGLRCFRTVSEADGFASTKERVTARSASSWVAQVTFFDRTGYSGASIRLGVTNGGCTTRTTDVEAAHPNLAELGWSNRASSFVTRNGCDIKYYDGRSYTGAHSAQYRDHDRDLRNNGWNNRISSFRVS